MKLSRRSKRESMLALGTLASRVNLLLGSANLVSQQSESSWGERPGVLLV